MKLHINSNFSKKQCNYPYSEQSDEIVTVPDQAMTIQQIMDRAKQGIEPEVVQLGYNPVDHIDEINENFRASYQLHDIDRVNQKLNDLKTFFNDLEVEQREVPESPSETLKTSEEGEKE